MISQRLLALVGLRFAPVHRMMSSKKMPSDLTLVVTKDDVEETLDFLDCSFIQHEPVIKTLGIEDSSDLLRYLKKNLSSDAVTLKLVDEHCDIVSAAVCVVSTPKSSQEVRSFAECSVCDPKTKRLLNLWADISDSHNLFQCFKVKEVWDIAMLSTAPLYQGMGLSKLLVQEARLAGKREGFSITRMDCTSHHSAKLAERLQFVTLPPRHILTFRDRKGVPWLAQAPPHPHGHVVVAYDFLT